MSPDCSPSDLPDLSHCSFRGLTSLAVECSMINDESIRINTTSCLKLENLVLAKAQILNLFVESELVDRELLMNSSIRSLVFKHCDISEEVLKDLARRLLKRSVSQGDIRRMTA